MSTKTNILLTALKLFNKDGLEHVSTYDIARVVGITQGNLTYHFPTKTKMVNILAKQMISEIDNEILTIENDFSFANFYKNLKHTFEINLKYQFLYMNYSQIVLNDSDLNDYFIKNSKGRKKLLKKMLIILLKNGYLITNDINDINDIMKLNDNLSDIINILAIYWIPESEIYHKQKSEKEIITHHLKLIFTLFKPYLTKKGLKNLKDIL